MGIQEKFDARRRVEERANIYREGFASRIQKVLEGSGIRGVLTEATQTVPLLQNSGASLSEYDRGGVPTLRLEWGGKWIEAWADPWVGGTLWISHDVDPNDIMRHYSESPFDGWPSSYYTKEYRRYERNRYTGNYEVQIIDGHCAVIYSPQWRNRDLLETVLAEAILHPHHSQSEPKEK